jgi:hypothetical protein
VSVQPQDFPPVPLDEGQAERRGRPHGAEADDGKSGGTSLGGQASGGNFKGDDSAGNNAQRSGASDSNQSGASGAEVERTSPGMSTEKKADDTK